MNQLNLLAPSSFSKVTQPEVKNGENPSMVSRGAAGEPVQPQVSLRSATLPSLHKLTHPSVPATTVVSSLGESVAREKTAVSMSDAITSTSTKPPPEAPPTPSPTMNSSEAPVHVINAPFTQEDIAELGFDPDIYTTESDGTSSLELCRLVVIHMFT
jgi:hypothetical protein